MAMAKNTSRSGIDWSEIKKKREEVKKTYPSVFKVPLAYGTKKKLIGGILKGEGGHVLDVGGGDRFAEGLCEKGAVYRSMDVDRSRFHDYYSLDDIRESFDAVLLLDVIEHLTLEEGAELLRSCNGLLNPGGRLVVTVPNNSHPTAFTGDCTHVTSYRYHDLGGLLLSSGFAGLEIFRCCAKRKLKDRALALLLMPALRFLDIDFATGILIVSKK